MTISKSLLSKDHIMIDLETTSTTPTAQIIQIAAVKFRLDGGKLSVARLQKLEDNYFMEYPRYDYITFQKDTLQWWLKNPNNVYLLNTALEFSSLQLSTILAKLNAFFSETTNPIIWAWPIHFDISILLNAYHQTKVQLPACLVYPNTRNIMDVRSFLNILPAGWASPVDKNKIPDRHNALIDCYVQIEILQAILADVFL